MLLSLFLLVSSVIVLDYLDESLGNLIKFSLFTLREDFRFSGVFTSGSVVSFTSNDGY